jgi:hypothetical protein
MRIRKAGMGARQVHESNKGGRMIPEFDYMTDEQLDALICGGLTVLSAVLAVIFFVIMCLNIG